MNSDQDNNLLTRLLFLFVLAAGSLLSGCRMSSGNAEEERRYVTWQIEEIKAGKRGTLFDPRPAFVHEFVNDPACARNIDCVTLTDLNDLSDRRLAALRQLPDLDAVNFYCTQDTDQFLSQIGGMDSITSLDFELTDVSDSGVRSLAQCRNLKSLTLYGGRPRVGNAGLRELEGHKDLEVLELINTSVTDEGLASLSKLPRLRSLTLFWEPSRGKCLTDRGLEHLKSLTHLEKLELSGGWASDDAVADLRTVLSSCKIETIASR